MAGWLGGVVEYAGFWGLEWGFVMCFMRQQAFEACNRYKMLSIVRVLCRCG